MRAALLCLALAACGVPQPTNEEVDAPPGADDATAIVVQEWSERLGADLDVADLPPVRWFEGPCLDYGYDDGVRCTTGGFAEHPWGESEIHVVARASVHESKLAHEVLHWVLQQADGDDDHGHLGPMWATVGEVERVLLAAGL